MRCVSDISFQVRSTVITPSAWSLGACKEKAERLLLQRGRGFNSLTIWPFILTIAFTFSAMLSAKNNDDDDSSNCNGFVQIAKDGIFPESTLLFKFNIFVGISLENAHRPSVRVATSFWKYTLASTLSKDRSALIVLAANLRAVLSLDGFNSSFSSSSPQPDLSSPSS